jgi:hypothetical protein
MLSRISSVVLVQMKGPWVLVPGLGPDGGDDRDHRGDEGEQGDRSAGPGECATREFCAVDLASSWESTDVARVARGSSFCC